MRAMARAEKTLTINRPPEAVFDFLADGANNQKWRPSVTEVEKQSGDGAGAVYRQRMKGPGGRAIDGDYRVTTFDRPRQLAFDVIAGPARPTGTFTLAPEGEGTRLTFVLELQPKGVMRLMSPMIVKTMQGEVANLDALKRVLEAEA
jgi:uncharacterized protein YndB with AHSA1/START domain